MEFSTLELQIFASLIVILGTAFVALIVDFLKGTNEKLRERNIELEVRSEEREKQPAADPRGWFQRRAQPTPLQHRTANWMKNAMAEESEAEPAAMVENLPMAVGGETHTMRIRSSKVEMEVFTSRGEQVKPEPVMPYGKPATAASVSVRVESPAVPELKMVAAPEPPRFQLPPFVPVAAETVPAGEPVVQVVQVVEPASHATVSVRSLILTKPAAAPQPPRVSEPQLVVPHNPHTFAVRLDDAPALPVGLENVEDEVEEEAPVQLLAIPTGYHKRAMLNRLLQAPEPISGLVVAININDYKRVQDNTGPQAFSELMQSVTNLMRSLISGEGFACRSNDDEFLLVFTGAKEEDSNRRIKEISERLWDFQLRSLGSFSILFNWGATLVRCEQLNEAIAAACDRMYQIKRSRKTQPLEFSTARRRVISA